MAEVLSVVKALLGEHLPQVQIEGSPAWAAHARQALRDHLVQTFKVSPDLSHWPDAAKVSLSVSHCPDWGGYAFSHKPGVQVGFDVEASSRLTLASVARVAKREELIKAPNEALLWCAKEAAFKALRGPNQPNTMSLVRVSNWQAQGASWRFQWGPNTDGLAMQTPKHTWAFAVISL